MKYFCVTDVHGFYKILRDSLDKAGFDPNNKEHVLVSCGDLLDRGPQPRECLEYVMSLPRKILICGNHEDLMEQAVARGFFLYHDHSNGTVDTAMNLTGEGKPELATLGMRDVAVYNEYIHELVNYHETDNYVFVHGWIPCYVTQKDNKNHFSPYEGDWRNASIKDWQAARWYNGMEAWHDGVKVNGKIILCGHWHSSWGNSLYHNDGMEFPNYRSTNPEHRRANFGPFIDDGIIAFDACTAYSHRINVITLED
jgi:serine/threonine protein phosphatase 1